MIYNKYEISIVSPFDREYLVAEIAKDDNFYAEINQENGYLEIQIYCNVNEVKHLELQRFCEVLYKTKLYLAPTNIKNIIIKNEFHIKEEVNEDKKWIHLYYRKKKVAICYLLRDSIELNIIVSSKRLNFPFDSFYNILMRIHERLRSFI